MSAPITPPPLAARIIARLIPPHWSEQFLDDLAEEFEHRSRTAPSHARWWYRRQVARVLWSRVTRRGPAPRSSAAVTRRLLDDAATAWRALRRQPKFAALVILVLGSSIGASAAVLTMVDAYLWKPLPYPASERLVLLGGAPRPPSPGANIPSPKDRSALDYSALGDIADLMLTTDADGLTILNEGNPQTVLGAWTTADIFSMFAVRPVAGRLFTHEEVAAGRPVAVISQRL